MQLAVALLHLYRSPGHNYRGHHGRPPGEHPVVEEARLVCVAGRGIQGDRYYDHQDNFKGQITFFADEVYQDLCARFQLWTKPPAVFRRNVITRGIDLNELIGAEFELQGVRFLGVESCRPCYWMDQAFCPGTEAALEGRGGLRARILSDGTLQASEKCVLEVAAPCEV